MSASNPRAIVRIPDTSEDAEEFFLECCELMPEDRLRHEVKLLKLHGYDLQTLDDFRAFFRLSCIFGVCLPLVVIRVLQVYPELRKRIAL